VRTDWGNRYLPKDIIAMNPLVGNTIKVFREAPEWDKAEKLWQLPGEKRQELYVTTYTVPVDEDGDPIDPQGAIRYVRERHPDCVLVY